MLEMDGAWRRPEMGWSRLGAIGASFTLAASASASSIDFIGIHQLAVNTVSPVAHTSLPFASSATGIGPGGLEPFGEFTGEQLSPVDLRFTGTVRNGAHVQMQSSIGFTLNQPTLVSISGWATLLDGDGVGPADFDARVVRAGLYNEVIFFTTADGTWAIDESAVLQPGFYTFHYSANAPQTLDQASYDFIVTIPEPSSLLLVGTGLIGFVALSRRCDVEAV